MRSEVGVASAMDVFVSSGAGLRVRKVALNKNTDWMNNRAAWAFYALLIIVSWLVTSTWVDPGMAWTYVHIAHGVITYFLFHWNKGSPIAEDQGKYDR
jgi:hypothetical protein